ncbi:hypothetical protein STENM36S_06283 [Streptomyces tendae]
MANSVFDPCPAASRAASLLLPAAPSAVREGRRRVGATLLSWGLCLDDDSSWSLTVVCGELLARAVRRAAGGPDGRLAVGVDVEGDQLIVDVREVLGGAAPSARACRSPRRGRLGSRPGRRPLHGTHRAHSRRVPLLGRRHTSRRGVPGPLAGRGTPGEGLAAVVAYRPEEWGHRRSAAGRAGRLLSSRSRGLPAPAARLGSGPGAPGRLAHQPPEVRRPGRPAVDDRLSPREREVAEPAARGLMNREIAVVLHLSPRTVEQHVARALRKTDALSRRDLLPTSQTPAPDSSSFSSASVTVREGSGGPPRGVEFVRGLSPRSGPSRPRPRPRCGAGPPTGSRGRPR